MSDDKTYPWSEKTPKPKISNADQNGHSDARIEQTLERLRGE